MRKQLVMIVNLLLSVGIVSLLVTIFLVAIGQEDRKEVLYPYLRVFGPYVFLILAVLTGMVFWAFCEPREGGCLLASTVVVTAVAFWLRYLGISYGDANVSLYFFAILFCTVLMGQVLPPPDKPKVGRTYGGSGGVERWIDKQDDNQSKRER